MGVSEGLGLGAGESDGVMIGAGDVLGTVVSSSLLSLKRPVAESARSASSNRAIAKLVISALMIVCRL